MAEREGALFQFDGYEQHFSSYDELILHLVEQRQSIHWINDFATTFGNFATRQNQAFDALTSKIAELIEQRVQLVGAVETVRVAFQGGSGGILRHSQGNFMKRLQPVWEMFDYYAAGFVWAVNQGDWRVTDATNLHFIAGTVLFAIPELGDTTASARRLDSERRLFREEQLSQRSRADEAIASLQAVEATYRSHLGLQAPVEYWRQKSADHAREEKSARKDLTKFFVFGTVALFCAFAVGFKLLPSNDNGHQSIQFMVTAGLAAFAAIIFWIGRILTKLFLSHNHLRQDAEERAVMTTTYLALMQSGAATENERSIILNALFRPSTDGIVKEDGAGDLSLASQLSRIRLPR